MIVAGIATIPSRIDQVKKTIESLLPQVDRIYVSLNDFRPSPMEMIALAASNSERVVASFTDGADEQKFRKVEGDIYLACDDDLIFPANYVEVIKQSFETYEQIAKYKCNVPIDIITFHGRNFNSFPIQSYYKSAGSKYRCLDKVAQDVPVQFGGTGCMAFKPANFNVTLKDFPSKYMADVHLAIKARKEGKRIMCIAHEAGWIKYQPVSNTIYDRFRDSDSEQTERVNEAFVVNSKLVA